MDWIVFYLLLDGNWTGGWVEDKLGSHHGGDEQKGWKVLSWHNKVRTHSRAVNSRQETSRPTLFAKHELLHNHAVLSKVSRLGIGLNIRSKTSKQQVTRLGRVTVDGVDGKVSTLIDAEGLTREDLRSNLKLECSRTCVSRGSSSITVSLARI